MKCSPDAHEDYFLSFKFVLTRAIWDEGFHSVYVNSLMTAPNKWEIIRDKTIFSLHNICEINTG